MTEKAKTAGGGFTADEERMHTDGFALIRAGLESGLGFEAACARLDLPDSELRRIIVDDYLKVAIAEGHFRDGRSTTELAAELRLAVDAVERAREEMLHEVGQKAAEAFRQQSGEFSPGESN